MGLLEDFMATPPPPSNSNTSWGSRYAAEIKQLIKDYSARRPRSVQKHLGPSEIGVACDRQVAAKFASVSTTNNVSDPWASFVGTAIHSEMEQVLTWDNERNEGAVRWLPEIKLVPHPDHAGTGDAYDGKELVILDFKALGDTTLGQLKREGPPRKYFVQLLAYRRGAQNLGLTVNRVVLVALPRTKSQLDGMYVWEHECTPEDDALLDEVFERTKVRKAMGDLIRQGKMTIADVPATPSDSDCYFCSWYRPEYTKAGPDGCPGTKEKR